MSVNTFFQKLVPVDKKFFPMYEHFSELIVKAATAHLMIFNQEDSTLQKELFKQLRTLREIGDDLSEKLFEDIDKSFVPPFDREDMNLLTTKLYEVIKQINGVSQRIKLYRPKEIPVEYKDFAQLILRAGEQVKLVVTELRSLKKPNKILKACKRINEMEDEADDLYHATISNLFKKEKDAIELIKQKEILENMEGIMDCIKGVSDIIKTIILKES